MVSKVTIIGIPIFLVGLILLTLFTFVGAPLFPFWTTTSKEYGLDVADQAIIDPFTIETVDLHVEQLPTHFTQVIIKARFMIGPQSGSGYSCNISLMYVGSREGRLARDLILDRPETDTWEEQSITGTVPLGYSSSSYSIKIDVINTGSNPILIGNRRIEMRFTLYSTYIPAIISIIGVIVIILGVTVLKGEPAVAKRKAITPGGWEPTLQWGGGTSTTDETTKKRPKMAIKSTKTATKAKKKAAPTPEGGGQQVCKFCGKNVPASAFFCPHCYGKLR